MEDDTPREDTLTRRKRINVALTEKQYSRYRILAHRSGETLADWCRNALRSYAGRQEREQLR